MEWWSRLLDLVRWPLCLALMLAPIVAAVMLGAAEWIPTASVSPRDLWPNVNP